MDEPVDSASETVEPGYEPPTLTALGSLADVTGVFISVKDDSIGPAP
jgi:hypothetical protein